jgi:hypothetical protein
VRSGAAARRAMSMYSKALLPVAATVNMDSVRTATSTAVAAEVHLDSTGCQAREGQAGMVLTRFGLAARRRSSAVSSGLEAAAAAAVRMPSQN